ncbi:bifunctional proline dehydrogenase/L-glutamate gamma-semialdehyde dehydrogenase [Mobilicoccus pelagius]|uniref:L-glutamate gamma-semialdehyde dehydrogenase n=1 Tax=Mobilicoccus pelagius NBRC 104925 TaxID=1089455 RepID=H5UVS1_9MICO|nr:bifunctional proline dehydrogenase/L-glutamate gamma-semialdehyde dehydrogenase [Mobilicoccus pelagius]GAB49829.1 proline dehydrogenase/delta-1-pyrroline-5-carboxylate dehydrogenase [Mobilicoccus pelagius NBRC 104925]
MNESTTTSPSANEPARDEASGIPAGTATETGDTTARDALAPLVEEAVALAHRWAEATEREQTKAEKATTGQLASLVRDEAGLDFAVRFVDRVARPEDNAAAARELSHLTTKNASSFLDTGDRALLGLGAKVATLAPSLVVPLARTRLKQMVGHLVGNSHDPALKKHLAQARAEGFRLNVNLLGEAVLGENEAASRTQRVTELLERDDVDYVSIKVSSLVSQISTWDHEGTVAHCLERLRPLYRVANEKSPKAFVNLDMEEYRDLDLTIDLFTRMLLEPEFHQLEAGIVLQAYLPDALPALEELIAFAQERVAQGRSGIKIRLVKGANLAMEQVEAAIHGWEQAPYDTKAEVDANYLRCVERMLREDAAGSVDGRPAAIRVGVASHNLFDIATAHLLAEQRGVTDSLDIEMLQGMAPAQSRAVKEAVGTVLLYTPVVAPEDFDVAVSYLIRRLEENATPGNFLHAIFDDGSRSGESPMAEQEERFRESVEAIPATSVGPRRRAQRAEIGDTFENTPDSDPALPEVRAWAKEALEATPPPLTSPVLESAEAVDDVVATAVRAQAEWVARPASERAALLREAARELEKRRGTFLTVMAAEGGKTLEQADPEVSEAIDFARYYADRVADLDSDLAADGARFTPCTVTLVTPPWNFPVAIPMGGVLAALAAGSAAIIKPANATPGCVELGMEALHAAGIPAEVAQVVRTDEGEVGKCLVSHPDVETVVLTGASETAHLFAGWRVEHARGARVYGETSGKNALVVTPAADLDLAAADLVTSAFGHAGQKCSAASLGILVGSVADSERFRRQLIDAVQSLRVGWPQDLSTTMGPVIAPPEGKLRRALTTLEPGERWIVEPRQLDDTGRLWSPGLKEGVAPGSFFHLTEVFGPVLGLMRADSLTEAIELQNATAYGLTAGLHSLYADEIDEWMQTVEAGNLYVNRHITGAIVRRQSFGGWKESSVGPGAKAGGPNYVAQLGRWEPDGLPTQFGDLEPAVRRALRAFLPMLPEREERTWLRAAAASDARAFEDEFGVERDDSDLVVETNVFRYRVHPDVWVRAEDGTSLAELLRLVLGAIVTGAPMRLSLSPATSATLKAMQGRDADVDEALQIIASSVDAAETGEDFLLRVERGDVGGRLRVLGSNEELLQALREEEARGLVTLYTDPVLATGRRELLFFLREQAVSRTMHRYGHLDKGAGAF